MIEKEAPQNQSQKAAGTKRQLEVTMTMGLVDNVSGFLSNVSEKDREKYQSFAGLMNDLTSLQAQRSNTINTGHVSDKKIGVASVATNHTAREDDQPKPLPILATMVAADDGVGRASFFERNANAKILVSYF